MFSHLQLFSHQQFSHLTAQLNNIVCERLTLVILSVKDQKATYKGEKLSHFQKHDEVLFELIQCKILTILNVDKCWCLGRNSNTILRFGFILEQSVFTFFTITQPKIKIFEFWKKYLVVQNVLFPVSWWCSQRHTLKGRAVA